MQVLRFQHAWKPRGMKNEGLWVSLFGVNDFMVV